LILPIALAKEPHALYGKVNDGVGTANGATVTVYPEGNPSDFVTDIVGETGNYGAAYYWKVNFYNLQSEVIDGSNVVIVVDDGYWAPVTMVFQVDLSKGNEYVGEMTILPSFTLHFYSGWNLIGLPLRPYNADNSEEFGDLLNTNEQGVYCDTIARLNAITQTMEDDIIDANPQDTPFTLAGGEGYFVHCDGNFDFTYSGTFWE